MANELSYRDRTVIGPPVSTVRRLRSTRSSTAIR